jgi:hypothetical protein
LFPICSHQVPNGSQSGSQCVPNINSLESHMFCPKSSPSHLYSWAKGGGNPLFRKIFYLGGASMVSTFFLRWANQIGSLQKKKKKVGHVRHALLINMKQNMSYLIYKFSTSVRLWRSSGVQVRPTGPGPAKTGEGLTGCDGGQHGRAGHGRVPAGPSPESWVPTNPGPKSQRPGFKDPNDKKKPGPGRAAPRCVEPRE